MNRRSPYSHYFVFVIIYSIAFVETSDLNINHVKFDGENSNSMVKYARHKIAKMHEMRHKLEQQRLTQAAYSNNNKTESEEQTKLAIFDSFRQIYPRPLGLGNNGLANSIVQAFKLTKGRSSSFWSKFFPSQDILKKLLQMRENLEPNLKSYITTKYNDFLTNLVPYSDNIGVPPFVLNSMKIPQNFDPRWSYIEKLLESSSIDNFLKTLPNLRGGRQLISEEVIESRSDDDFISDQEPHPISKGKKKYRFPNRIKVYRKGETSSKISPAERAGYDPGYYSTAGSSGSSSIDHYGLYGTGHGQNNGYDSSNGKGYEDYYSSKRGNEKSNLYDDYSNKGSGKYLTTSGFGETIAAGHNSYSSKGHGHSQSGGHGLGGYLDPFSILGGLAFLTYLGLLFQQSMNSTGMGREFGESLFLEQASFKGIKPFELTRERKAFEQKENLHKFKAIKSQLTFLRLNKSIREIYLEASSEMCRFQKFCNLLKQNWKNTRREKIRDAFDAGDAEKVTKLFEIIQFHKQNTKCQELYKCV